MFRKACGSPTVSHQPACAKPTHADGLAEHDGATPMLDNQGEQTPRRRRTLGADKNYDTHGSCR